MEQYRGAWFADGSKIMVKQSYLLLPTFIWLYTTVSFQICENIYMDVLFVACEGFSQFISILGPVTPWD